MAAADPELSSSHIERVADIAAQETGSGAVVLTSGVNGSEISAAIARRMLGDGRRILVLASNSLSSKRIAVLTGGISITESNQLGRLDLDAFTPEIVAVPKQMLHRFIKDAEKNTSGRRFTPDLFGPRDAVLVESCQDSIAPGGIDLIQRVAAFVGPASGQPARFVGIAELPARSDGLPLHPVFEGIEFARITREQALADGSIVPTRCLVPEPEVVDHLTRGRKGVQLAEDLDVESIVIQTWKRYASHGIGSSAQGMPTILHAGSVPQAESFAAAFNGAGHTAACISSETTGKERRRILGDFAAGRLTLLAIHHAELNEPEAREARCTMFARAGMQPAHFLRSLAAGSAWTEGKEEHLVLDFVDNASRWRESPLFRNEDLSPFDPASLERIPVRTRRMVSERRIQTDGPRPAKHLEREFSAEGDLQPANLRRARLLIETEETGANERQLLPLVRIGEASWMFHSPSSDRFGMLMLAEKSDFIVVAGKVEGDEFRITDARFRKPDSISKCLDRLSGVLGANEAKILNDMIERKPDQASTAALRGKSTETGKSLGGLSGGSDYALRVHGLAHAISDDLESRVAKALLRLELPPLRTPIVGRSGRRNDLSAKGVAEMIAPCLALNGQQAEVLLSKGVPFLALAVVPASFSGSVRCAMKGKPSSTLSAMHEAGRLMSHLAEALPGEAHDSLEVGRRLIAQELVSRGVMPPDIERRLRRTLTSPAGGSLSLPGAIPPTKGQLASAATHRGDPQNQRT